MFARPWLLVVAAAYATAWLTLAPVAHGETLVRVTCRGVHKLELDEAELGCAESAVLSGPGGIFVPHGSASTVRLPTGQLEVEAYGGAIRDVGHESAESSSLLKTELRFQHLGADPVTARIVLRIDYDFSGSAESGLDALLRSAAPGSLAANRMQITMGHGGFSGAWARVSSRSGRTSGPAPGRYPARGTVQLVSLEHLEEEGTVVVIRTDLRARVLANLGSLDPTGAATARARARLRVVVPCGVRATGSDGRALAPAGRSQDPDRECLETLELSAGDPG